MRMVFIAAVLMLALLAAIVGSVSADPASWERPTAHVVSDSTRL